MKHKDTPLSEKIPVIHFGVWEVTAATNALPVTNVKPMNTNFIRFIRWKIRLPTAQAYKLII